uniref:IQ motif containing G n=1 Tax=Pseudonaja textilis TaxID=8673 RepID=A0A670ZMZ4_PSETE
RKPHTTSDKWESWIWIKNTTPKLPPLDAVRLSAVLEDCTDQLAILGYIMPVSYEGRKDVEDVSVVPGCERVTDGCLQGNRKSSQMQENARKLRITCILLAERFRKRSLLRSQPPCAPFSHPPIYREEMGRKKIKSLQKQLGEIKKEKDYELQNRNEMIAYLKDQLQEMKAKTDMENRYVKKDTDLQVAQVQKKCFATENDLQNEIEKLRNEMDQEIRIHIEIVAFLKQHIEEKLEYWMEKYEKETEAKQQALNNLKSSRAADQAALMELAKQCRACEQAIIEDRKEKENARKKVEQDALEMKSILKVRGCFGLEGLQ